MNDKQASNLVYFAYNPIEVNHRAAVFMAKNCAEQGKVVKIIKTSKGLRCKIMDFKGNDANAYGYDLHLYDTLTSNQPISVGSFD